MIGLAVGIDYALFILHRYREHLAEGLEHAEAAARATATAGTAVVFAGLTVVIALSGLAVVNIPFRPSWVSAAAGTVVIAVLIAITLLPALMGFAGSRITRPKPLGRAAAADSEPKPFGQLALGSDRDRALGDLDPGRPLRCGGHRITGPWHAPGGLPMPRAHSRWVHRSDGL